MTFRVGQKVACVRDGRSLFTGAPSGLVAGRVYTVTKAWRDDAFRHPVCLIAEVAPAGGYAFDALRFRPVQERKTDISIFTAMLNPSQVTVDALNTADFARENAG